MKQNCHFQNSLLQCKNATKPLRSSEIHATHQHFQKWYITLFLLKGLKSYQPSKFECLYFPSKTYFTFLLWLITFEPLELTQRYIPLLKVYPQFYIKLSLQKTRILLDMPLTPKKAFFLNFDLLVLHTLLELYLYLLLTYHFFHCCSQTFCRR